MEKVLSTTLKTSDTFVMIATTSTSVTLSVSGFGLVLLPISNVFSCRLTLIKKVLKDYFRLKITKIENNWTKLNKLSTSLKI